MTRNTLDFSDYRADLRKGFEMSKKILVIGSANIDLSMNMFRVPAQGETLIDDGGVAYTPGGKGANAAIAFAASIGEPPPIPTIKSAPNS